MRIPKMTPANRCYRVFKLQDHRIVSETKVLTSAEVEDIMANIKPGPAEPNDGDIVGISLEHKP